MGTTLHDGLSAIAGMSLKEGGVDIDLIATTARKQMFDSLLEATSGEFKEVEFAYEQSTLVEGLLRGFFKHSWPRLMEQYPTILYIEQEMEFRHDGLVFMSKPDLVVEDKEGNVVYVEYKSTSSKKEGWVNSWATAVQLHSTIKAIKATTGRDVGVVKVQGLYKGYESYGKQSSPFCYAYRRNGNPPFTKEEVRYEYAAGFKRYPTWEMAGGVKQWVEAMPENVLGDQFPEVPPIFIKEDLVDAFFRQRAVREREIDLAKELMKWNPEAKEEILNTAFPQRFDQCHPYFGKPCTYLRICHGGVQDHLKEGYEYRIPHHTLEVEVQEGESEVVEQAGPPTV